MRTPKHIHWVIDLIIKKEHDKDLTVQFMKYLREMYDSVDAFKDKTERASCVLLESEPSKLEQFEGLNEYGEYKIEFICKLIELMIRMEKNTPPEKPAKVFKELIDALIKERDIFTVVGKATQVKYNK